MPEREHLLLVNPIVNKQIFLIHRGQENNNNGDESTPRPENYRNLKDRLYNNYQHFISDRASRQQRRTLDVPAHIDYIKINFFQVLDSDFHNYFRQNYGLYPVVYENLNQTVYYAIKDQSYFRNFTQHLESFINSTDQTDPHNEIYSRLINIESFLFLTSNLMNEKRLQNILHLELVDDTGIVREYHSIYADLIGYLEACAINYSNEISDKLIELKGISREQLIEVLDNFDIIKGTTSSIPSRRYPGVYGERRLAPPLVFNTDLTAPIIGIIDTGINKGGLLKSIVIDYQLDIANNSPTCFFDDDGHGTIVAFLAAFGEDYYSHKSDLTNTARVLPIKIMNNGEDNYSLSDLVKVIRLANRSGVRIFNLSVNSKFNKSYNESMSSYAYALDKLAFELDILIFISTGNLGYEDMESMSEGDMFRYPYHFYNPMNQDFYQFGYDCSMTNIKPPADSLNNMVVGAIADNFYNQTDLTPDRTQVAYYSLKWHLDCNQPVNSATKIKMSQINNHLFKPDVVCPGGDALSSESGLNVLYNGWGDKFISSFGTSNAAPICANIAARILKYYPALNMQSVKALIVNSSERQKLFPDFENLLSQLKQRFSNEIIGTEFIDFNELSKDQKTTLSKKFNIKKISNVLQGHGRPNAYKATFSDENSVTFIIQEEINIGTHIAFKLDIPDYFNNMEGRRSSVLEMSATLCYKFNPVPNNQLAYCPLHISFAIRKNIDNDINSSLDVLSNFENSRIKEGKFKSGLSWSDDFYPINAKPFSNCQKLKLNINRDDLINCGNSFAILIRAQSKSELDEEVVNSLRASSHPFSFVIRLEEVPYKGKTSGALYDRIQLCNSVEAIATLEQEINLDLNS